MSMTERYDCSKIPKQSATHLDDFTYGVLANQVLLLALYERYSLGGMGGVLGVARSTVHRYLAAHGAKLRKPGEQAPLKGEPMPPGLQVPDRQKGRTARQQIIASVRRLYMLGGRCARAHCPYHCEVLDGGECQLREVLMAGGELERREWEPEDHFAYWEDRLDRFNGRGT